MVLIYGVDKSVDFCPNCEKRLCPFKGAYTLNVVTYDVSVVCNGCSKTVVIKDLFSERQKALVWNDTKVWFFSISIFKMSMYLYYFILQDFEYSLYMVLQDVFFQCSFCIKKTFYITISAKIKCLYKLIVVHIFL